jgi:saccharopine dehydrogenase-like NADP-dependent oxidoreductase
VTLLRVEAKHGDVNASFSMVDSTDDRTGLTSMMRTTAWPASIVLQMMIDGQIAKRGGVRQEIDVPAQLFLNAMAQRGITINYSIESGTTQPALAAAAQEN